VLAGIAEAVQQEFMRGEQESSRDHLPKIAGTHFQLEHLPAGVAVEVVMMLFAGPFIAGRLSGKVNRDQPAFLDKGLEVAIDGGDADSFAIVFCCALDLFRREWLVEAIENRTDRRSLLSFTEFQNEMLFALSFARSTGRQQPPGPATQKTNFKAAC
jgi:hypothetical protein